MPTVITFQTTQRNWKSTHKVLAPRIDSKSRSTTRPTIRNRSQNRDKNNQRTPIEQRGCEPKGGKKKTRPTTQRPTPTLMIMVDESLELGSVLAPFWLRWNQPNDLAPFRFWVVFHQAPAGLKVPLRSMSCWNLRRKHKHPFQICEQSQRKRRLRTRSMPVEQRT